MDPALTSGMVLPLLLLVSVVVTTRSAPPLAKSRSSAHWVLDSTLARGPRLSASAGAATKEKKNGGDSVSS
jgi:hypothetical protein